MRKPKKIVGQTVGGTEGNPVFEFLGVAPVKERVVEKAPDPFSYTEISKYGFDHLLETIIEQGGHRKMYDLMGVPAPPPTEYKQPGERIKFDYTGETDEARYKGLKLATSLDDDAIGEALRVAQDKQKRGEPLRAKIVEELEENLYPFKNVKNVGPKQTPDWTPARLDEEGRKIGQADSWALEERKKQEKEERNREILDFNGASRAYAIAMFASAALGFGKATPAALTMLDLDSSIQTAVQIPAFVLLVSAVGSSILAAVVLAPEKNRSPLIWGLQALVGGPVAVLQLRNLEVRVEV